MTDGGRMVRDRRGAKSFMILLNARLLGVHRLRTLMRQAYKANCCPTFVAPHLTPSWLDLSCGDLSPAVAHVVHYGLTTKVLRIAYNSLAFRYGCAARSLLLLPLFSRTKRLVATSGAACRQFDADEKTSFVFVVRVLKLLFPSLSITDSLVGVRKGTSLGWCEPR